MGAEGLIIKQNGFPKLSHLVQTFPISGNCTFLSPKSPLCLPLSSHLIWRFRLWLIDTEGRVGGSFTRALFQRRLDGKMTDGELERC